VRNLDPETELPVAGPLAVVPVDANGDGRLDLLFTYEAAPAALFLNEGQGVFRRWAAGLGERHKGAAAATLLSVARPETAAARPAERDPLAVRPAAGAPARGGQPDAGDPRAVSRNHAVKIGESQQRPRPAGQSLAICSGRGDEAVLGRPCRIGLLTLAATFNCMTRLGAGARPGLAAARGAGKKCGLAAAPALPAATLPPMPYRIPVGFLLAALLTSIAGAAPLTITIPPAPGAPAAIPLGTARPPDGTTLTVDSASLRLDGRPWVPAMGEFHYSRYPADEWRGELLKLKAGGLDIVSTYVFWIHHEEIEGRWDWSGDRDLRRFVQLAGEAGLKVVVRCGPWCHGEVRNGGIPDWAMNRKDWRVRSLDPGFLNQVRALYGQIAAQLHGLLWKDGGPVIGIQLDNEYGGPAEYLLALKQIAVEAGLDVPLYTRTGWPALRTPLPFGAILPLYGAYAEGFWDRQLTSMPGRYWAAFRFALARNEADAATEQYGRRAAAGDDALYPYLTCEIGGGMMSSYHRRILIQPEDVAATVLVKLGSGSVLPGYYMYHGGTNPDGVRTTLMEAQDTPGTNWNDLPVKNYDFQAPVGQFGQLRPQYHLLRRLHLFLHDFGAALARMPAALPDQLPGGRDDTVTLRWAVRSDGVGGFVFVNNYQRSLTMPPKAGVQFQINLPGGPLVLPAAPITIPADARFIWPFNLDLGHGVRLTDATAEPVCTVDDGAARTVFFAETPGVIAEFQLAGEPAPRTARAGRGEAFRVAGPDGGTVRVVLLSEADSLALWKGPWRGAERAFLSRAGLVFDGGAVHLTADDPSLLQVGVCPAPAGFAGTGADGVFTDCLPPSLPTLKDQASFPLVLVRKAGPPRMIPLGRAGEPVAAEPTDADFRQAAVWRVEVGPNLDLASHPILRLHYVGDVARITLNGRLIDDDFYNGRPMDLGLWRYAPEITRGELEVEILPLQRAAVEGPARKIFLAPAAIPDFKGAADVAELTGADLVRQYEAELR